MPADPVVPVKLDLVRELDLARAVGRAAEDAIRAAGLVPELVVIRGLVTDGVGHHVRLAYDGPKALGA